MHISVEINGVETKWTCLSSFAVVLFALVQLIGIILLFAHVGWDTMPVVDGVLNIALLSAASAGAFLDAPPLKFFSKTHAHRAVVSGLSVILLVIQSSGTWNANIVIPFVVIGTLFFLGHVAASIASCFQRDKMQETLIAQDIRTSTVETGAAAQSGSNSASASASSVTNSASIRNSAKPGIVETSFNEL